MAIQDLDQRFPIIDPKTGKATDYFMRMLRGVTGPVGDAEADIATLFDDVATLEARNLIAGAGLTGGGTLAADRTFTVGAGTGITVNADDVAIANTAVTPGSYTNTNLTVDQQGRITLAANGSSGGGAWTELDYYDATASGSTSGRTVDVSSYNEVLIIFDLVTLTASGWRVVQVSVDGGSTWLTAAADYTTITSPTGAVGTDTAIFSHGTATTAARSADVFISPLRSTRLPKTALCPVRAQQEHINTASAITHIRAIGWTSAPAVTNMTGGKIAVYGR
jgi:hypothetical protein